jgi:hypothetical protein
MLSLFKDYCFGRGGFHSWYLNLINAVHYFLDKNKPALRDINCFGRFRGSQKTSVYCNISLHFISFSQTGWFRMYDRIAVQLGYYSRQCKCTNSIIKVNENCSIGKGGFHSWYLNLINAVHTFWTKKQVCIERYQLFWSLSRISENFSLL